MKTIFAVSSGRPPAGIAIIRVSGGAAIAAAESIAGRLPPPRTAALRALRGSDGSLLDRALVLLFPAPESATGEDVVELHCHGGRAVIDAVEAALAAIPGVYRAEPGEFTRRALINGRIDLAQAEGLADLLSAETERQRRAAIDAAEGRLSGAVRAWLDDAALLSARTEALLDFSDEDDVAAAADVTGAIVSDMAQLSAAISAIADAVPVERLRDGIRIVIAGPPNSGKSTLINALSDREVAIVTPISGTTRDRVDAPVMREGIAYVITDTAGLTATDDVVEAIGVDRARAALAGADLLLWMGDDPPPRDAIWVHARADVAGREAIPAGRDIAVSSVRPASIAALWTMIANRSEALLPAADRLALTRGQRDRCREAAAALVVGDQTDLIVIAEHLRLAIGALAAIIGVDALEETLDALFGRFCIGK